MKRAALFLLTATLIAADAPPYQSSPARLAVVETRDWGPWGGPFRAKLVPALMRDFGERYIYAPANAALPPPTRGEHRVVFLGDSITDMWNLSSAFPGKPYINRGIGAQVTAQMLVRFETDVVALKPSAVIILAGTNDVSGFLQVETPATILANITAMADIADARGIRIILSSILPVNDYTDNARHVVKERPPETLRAINVALRDLARHRGYVYADYAAPLADKRGLLCAECTGDGLHPNSMGYTRMAPVAAAAITSALRSSAPRRDHHRGK
ncbi:GDSL-type esterase/lipase family protein [Sphingomonas alpina]|uniref:GDSL family lipase n=1 Tax=Sphingomonas alpina TaxID=653931 RepID=A0A7H0LD69_9SPHN|nr:GDSL-type esterase/lipase family protein [Sphingomonas alpina]QNQ07622.1 GDSL family lipase [Sphingomonas alpina]